MELLLRTRCDDQTDDLVVSVDDRHTIGDLAAAIGGHLGVTVGGLQVERTGETPDAATAIADADIVSGDLVRLRDRAEPFRNRASADPAGAAVTVDIVAGPDSGTSQVLVPGRLSIGRHQRVDLVVDDPSVSRHHLDVVIDTDGTVTVHPIESAVNGVTVNDEFVFESTVVGVDDTVGIGGSRLAFRPFARQHHERIDRLGQIEFLRTPYRPPVVTEPDTEPIGPIPSRPEPRRFQFISVIGPLVAGVAMYSITGRAMYLIFTLLSPIMLVGNAIDDRRSGRRKFKQQLADFRSMLQRRRLEFEAARDRERIDRLRTAPDLADLVRRAEQRSIDLWPRGRTAPDMLAIRLGLAEAPVSFTIETEPSGDDEFKVEARQAMDGLDTIEHMPVLVELASDAVVGVHGPDDLVDGVASSMICQTAVLHSPEDVVMAAMVAHQRPFGWLKWLPHVRAVTSPLSGAHLVHTRDDANSMVNRLLEIAEFRHDAEHGSDVVFWPRLVVVIDSRLGPDPAQVSRLVDLAPAASISVIWLAPSAAEVTRQATRIVSLEHGAGASMIGRLWSVDPTVDDIVLEVEHLRPAVAERAARALAPVRDASTASQSTSIPRVAPLLDVLDVGSASPSWVIDNWRRNAARYGLPFSIGIGAEGPIEIDLVENGPHTLIGGTSGSGKSELLQSMVAALAAGHGPDRLNFLFIDYKGGASSQVFHRLPHTVGYVTNLSADLSLRALTSLRAELNRRMAVMEGRAKDLAEMLDKYPDDAPASLVIIVDEFATLVKEVPEFVDGIIDIAQRGRSLGIHLVLATQRPSGSVNENILANTNLRMSLRMLERSESNSVIDAPDAADIPVPLRGRGYVRLGPRRLVEFQSAFAGAPLTADVERQPVLVADFDSPESSPRGTGAPVDDESTTHLTSVLDAVVAADQQLGMVEPLKPWREVLPGRLSLAELAGIDPERQIPAVEHPGRFVLYGLYDAPEQQAQRPALVDLEAGGGWLVFGSGGAGKTTLLRTVAASVGFANESSDADGANVLAIDFGSRGLQALASMPHVIDVAAGDDLEAVTRNIELLDREVARRRTVLADAGAENLTAYLRDHPPMPRIVFMVDNFGALVDTLFNYGNGMSAVGDQWAERVSRIIIDGRQVGVHSILAADRRNAVPARLHSAISNRLVMRHADRSSYTDYGVAHARSTDLELDPGRALIDGETSVQVALVSDDDGARAQAESLASFAPHLRTGPSAAMVSQPLPTTIAYPERDPSTAATRRLSIGVVDITGETAEVDLAWSHAAVAGPPRSGRSTALAAMARSAVADGLDVATLGPASSPLRELKLGEFGDATVVNAELERLLAELEAAPRPFLLVIDDLDMFDDMSMNATLERLLAIDSLRLAASVEARSMSGYSSNPALGELRRCRRLLMLAPDDPTDFLQVTGVRMSARPGLRLNAGRGVLLLDRIPSTVQIFDALAD